MHRSAPATCLSIGMGTDQFFLLFLLGFPIWNSQTDSQAQAPNQGLNRFAASLLLPLLDNIRRMPPVHSHPLQVMQACRCCSCVTSSGHEHTNCGPQHHCEMARAGWPQSPRAGKLGENAGGGDAREPPAQVPKLAKVWPGFGSVPISTYQRCGRNCLLLVGCSCPSLKADHLQWWKGYQSIILVSQS